jgi:hypothetical protein
VSGRVPAREFYSAQELADLALPGLPETRQGLQLQAQRENWADPAAENRLWRQRSDRGGGIEYSPQLLPLYARVALGLRGGLAPRPALPRTRNKAHPAAEMWAWFDRQPDTRKAEARRRLEVLHAIDVLADHGVSRTIAIEEAARLMKIGKRTIWDWFGLVQFADRGDWLPFLAPRVAGGGAKADIDPAAWDALKADYLRPERPDATACVRRLRDMAATNGWTLPSDRTLYRRLQAIDIATVTLRRHGEAALKRMIPAQARDRSALHALEAVNADGHVWDVFVRWPDGTIARPAMTAFQDVYSGMILSWRIDRSENWHAVRLAFGDLVEKFGIPDHCLFDNGRHYASKKITGGTANRYRFKLKDEEPEGILTALQVTVHWAAPYSGQSKPIERAFRDFARDLAKHPRFAGAYTGNDPLAKPENYGSRAVPLDVFMATVAEGVTEHNDRTGRTGGLCAGRSFRQTFEESYAGAVIRRATNDERRLWLLAAEQLGVRRQDASVELMGNRYWADFLWPLRGQRVTARFDPEKLQQPLHIYHHRGAYLGEAPCLEAAGFLDAAAAQEHARKRRAMLRHYKAAAAAETSLTIDELAAMMPAIAEAEPPPPPKVVRIRPMPRGSAALPVPNEIEEEREPEIDRLFRRAVQMQRGARNAPLRLVADDED